MNVFKLDAIYHGYFHGASKESCLGILKTKDKGQQSRVAKMKGKIALKKLMAIQHCGEVGGSGIGLLSVLDMLKDQFEIIVYCLEQPKDLIEYYHDHGYKVIPVTWIPSFPYHSGGPRITETNFIMRCSEIGKEKHLWTKLIREESPDFVLVNSMILAWMWDPIRAAGARSICHVREVLPGKHNPLGKYLLRDLEHFDAVWFISEHEKTFFDLHNPKTALIRDCDIGSGSERVESAMNCNDDRFRVLYVGGMSQLKGIDVLVSAVPLTEDRVVIEFAGYMPEYRLIEKTKFDKFSFLKNLIQWPMKLKRVRVWKTYRCMLEKHKDKVIVLGHRNNISEFYSNCDVLVFPSRFPHQSRPAFEAGFYGKPVIISDFEQTRENVRDGYNGLTFRPNNPKSLAEAINRLCEDRSLCRRLGENNWINSKEKHTYIAVQTEMIKFWWEFLECPLEMGSIRRM